MIGMCGTKKTLGFKVSKCVKYTKREEDDERFVWNV